MMQKYEKNQSQHTAPSPVNISQDLYAHYVMPFQIQKVLRRKGMLGITSIFRNVVTRSPLQSLVQSQILEISDMMKGIEQRRFLPCMMTFPMQFIQVLADVYWIGLEFPYTHRQYTLPKPPLTIYVNLKVLIYQQANIVPNYRLRFNLHPSKADHPFPVILICRIHHLHFHRSTKAG